VIELKILSGKQAGATAVARRFPFVVGRSPQADLRLEDEGIFERHFELRLNRREGFALVVGPNAYAAVNGETAQQKVLRAGDVISAGSVKLAFALAPAPARGSRWREAMLWIGLALVCLTQVAIIYLLLES
jgi:hypothetical protein